MLAQVPHAANVRVQLRGMVQGMNESFSSFAIGFTLSFMLLYLILIAQFKSFIDPILIMLAIPMGVTGVLLILLFTNTTLNVMSLMGVLMLVGIANSNSILIVDFAHRAGRARAERGRRRYYGMPRALAADPDDLSCDHHRHDPDGIKAGDGRRTVRSHGARHHRRPDIVGSADHIYRTGGLPVHLPEKGEEPSKRVAGACLPSPSAIHISLSSFAWPCPC